MRCPSRCRVRKTPALVERPEPQTGWLGPFAGGAAAMLALIAVVRRKST